MELSKFERAARVLAAILSIALAAAVIVNAALRGNIFISVGLGMMALAAYLTSRGLRAEDDHLAMHMAIVASGAVTALLGWGAYELLQSLAIRKATEVRYFAMMGSAIATLAILFCVLLVAMAMRYWQKWRLEWEEEDKERRRVELLRQLSTAKMANGVSILDHIHGVRPPEPVKRATARTRPALHLSRTGLPVSLNDLSRSYLGGLPQLPPHLKWPEQKKHSSTQAFMFIAQIDLTEVSAQFDADQEATGLPQHGTLYFFFDGTNESPDEDNVRVLYHPERADGFPLKAPPENLPGYGCGDESWPWLDSTETYARIGFKFPLAFTKFASHCDYEPLEACDPVDLNDRELVAKVPTRDAGSLPSWDVMNEGDPSWPFVWAVTEHACRALTRYIDRFLEDRSRALSADILETLARIRTEAFDWLTRIAKAESLSECDSESRADFRRMWSEFDAALEAASKKSASEFSAELRRMLYGSLKLSCFLCASHESAGTHLIPDSYRRALVDDALWHVRRPGTYEARGARHQMLGFGLSVQSAPRDHEDDLLLLQICGMDGLSWFPTTGTVLQFWINPRDAAAGRYERTRITLESD